MKGYKKHLILLAVSINRKLQKIKERRNENNIQETISNLIEEEHGRG